jgi:peptidoglycan hydrolase-like protein with peptidoglycan-binding domain
VKGRGVRNRRAALGVAALLALATACGGGGHPSAINHQSSPSAPPPPLKVTSVTPHHLQPTSALTVSFTTTVTDASPLPTIHPQVPGSWARQGATAVFTPSQPYPPDTPLTVKVAKRTGAKSKPVAHRMTPHGSLIRAEQILAHLHYLPLSTSAATPTTPAEEAAAVYTPPPGKFTWRFTNVPASLRQEWSPGHIDEVLRGAVLAFQHHVGLTADTSIGQHTWAALIKADLNHEMDPDRYSYVSADLYLPQRLSVWVEGKTVITSPVNGGVAGAPTPLGTYPVYDRYTSTTMSGTNPSGSHYNDPGVPWVNYFSGGSAVHGFPRASYGTPQSVGCLELPIPTAKKVYGLISYGTLVHVTGPKSSSPTAAKPAAPTNTQTSKPRD